MEDVIRIGTISTVDADHGMAQVYYQDRDSTTGQLHLFAYRAEFAPPAVGDQVIVLHLPGNTCNGVILGRFWSEADPPPVGENYQKELIPGITESVQGAEYKLTAPGITFQSRAGSITVAELIALRSKVEALEEKI